MLEPGFKVKVQRRTRGAYFRKLQSSARVEYHGIRGVGFLPRVTFDPDCYYVSPEGPDHYQTGLLDRPSVYMGGHAAGKEMDVGLTWDRVYDALGRPTYSDSPEGIDGRDPAHRFVRTQSAGIPVLLDGNGAVVAEGTTEVSARMEQLRPNFAFRPFWRTTNEGGNQWNQPRPGAADNLYFSPGEKFAMSVRISGPERVRMTSAWKMARWTYTSRRHSPGRFRTRLPPILQAGELHRSVLGR